MGLNIYSLIGIFSAICVIVGFIVGFFQLKSYIAISVKKGSQDAASAAASEWKSLADAKAEMIEELKGKVKNLEGRIDILTSQNQEQKEQIDTLQKKIEGMFDINTVGEGLQLAVTHFNERIDEEGKKTDLILELLKNQRSVTVVK